MPRRCPFCGAPETGVASFACGTSATRFYIDGRVDPENWKISRTCFERMQEQRHERDK